MDKPRRFPWNHFPDVFIHATEQRVKQHPSYRQAKTGDATASISLVVDSLSVDVLDRMSRVFGAHTPVLLAVQAEELSGTNPIPRTMAKVIADMLQWDVEKHVFQKNVVGHTGASGFVRLAKQVVFGGAVRTGVNYLLIDDFIGQGGTLANLRGHVLAQGGQVLGASVLTGKAYSARLALVASQLDELRSKHGTIEFWWRQRFGFGFDCLTASEARYLIQTATSERIIERLEEADGGG
jgi:hypothetical protein